MSNEQTAVSASIPGDMPQDLEKATSASQSSHVQSSKSEEKTDISDPNIVDWEGPDDPSNPRNWSAAKKWWNVGAVSLICLIPSLSIAMPAPGITLIMQEFDSDNDLLSSFTISVFVLAFALAPLILAPLSELYGRLYLYHICNTLFLATNVACALSVNLPMLIVFRFLSGCMGASPIGVGGGTISDLFEQEERGGAIAIFSLGPLVGPVLGPIAGGFLAEYVGWRWVFWVLTIVMGAAAVASLIILRETYPVVLLERKAAALRASTGNPSLRSSLTDSRGPASTLLKRTVTRPLRVLFLSPIVLCLAVYGAFIYGVMFLLFSTFPLVFEEQYGFSSSTSGLSYLGIGIGMFLGVVVMKIMSDRILKTLAAKNGGEMKPEYRLPPMVCTAPLLPIGLFWYGWSAEAETHWIVPILGTSIVGIGMFSLFIAAQTYLVDSYPLYAASAIAANTLLRSLCGALLPLSGLGMYEDLGLGWGNSLLGFICLAFIPIPALFYRYGEALRTKFQPEL